MSLLAISLAIVASSLYGIVRASLAFAEKIDANSLRGDRDDDMGDLDARSVEGLEKMRGALVNDYNWWRKVGDANLRTQECNRTLNQIARIGRVLISKVGE